MVDADIEYGSDQEISENHSKFIEAVSQLDKGQRVKKARRNEPSLEVSEFHLVKSGVSDKDAVRLDDLAKTLGRGGGDRDTIRKKFQATQQRSKILRKPLEKPAADRVKRIVGFENSKKELNKWDAIVARNRAAGSLSFSAKESSLSLESTDRFVKKFRLESELEKELAKLEPEKPVITEKVDEFRPTLEEITEKRKEAAKFRAQRSYKAAEAHRRKKIKSKKFHTREKKIKLKEQMKEFEKLKDTDPEAALEKLEMLDRTRAHERMSLRHKNTGQWAKNKQVRAKYNKEIRQVLAQQLSIGKMLTEKIRTNENEEDEEENDEEIQDSSHVVKSTSTDAENPWVNGIKTEAEVTEFISACRSYVEKKKNESKEQENKNDESPEITVVESITENPTKPSVSHKPKIVKKKKVINRKIKKSGSTSQWDVVEQDLKTSSNKKSPENITRLTKPIEIEELFDSMEEKLKNRVNAKLESAKRNLERNSAAGNLEKSEKRVKTKYAGDLSLKKDKIRPDIDEKLSEATTKKISDSETIEESTFDATKSMKFGIGAAVEKSALDSRGDVDPNKFINVKPKHLMTPLPDVTIGGEDGAIDDSEDEENDEDDRHKTISEAFADDDVVDEFRKEKAEEVKKSQLEDVDLGLPGWGSWGGKNIAPSNRKKRRFIMKFPKIARRRDENKGDVVIIEEKDPKIKAHRVNELPFPFTSVRDFEASIRAPIGRNFVPENAHRRFIKPAVRTTMGAIIEPMDADALIAKKPQRKSNAGNTDTREKMRL